jgi:anti-sigma B factor antagonist
MFDFYISLAMPADSSGVAVVTVIGEVDASTASRLEDTLVAVIDGDVQTCVLDLTGVRFLDSSGISALVNARHVLDAQGVALRTCTGERVHAVFELAGMVDYFAATRDGVDGFEVARQPSIVEPEQRAAG